MLKSKKSEILDTIPAISGVYKITNKSNGKVYIGQSINIKARVESHINNKYVDENSSSIDSAIKKEGFDAFTYEAEFVAPELNTEQLWALEWQLIKKYDSNVNGYNKTKGNHIDKLEDFELFHKRYVVSISLTQHIDAAFNLNYIKGQNILLIRAFNEQYINMLKYHGVNVTVINKYTEKEDELGNYILEELKKYKGMKFDLILANPPYGSVGANILKYIIDNIEFDKFIALLPIQDYYRNDTKDLYKYVKLDTVEMTSFDGAAVTTAIAELTKTRHEFVDEDEFIIETAADNQVKKFFYRNYKRTHYAVSMTGIYSFTNSSSIDTSVIFGRRDLHHGHLAYDKNTYEYRWNVLKNITFEQMSDEIFSKSTSNRYHKELFKPYDKRTLCKVHFDFATAKEKDNFVKFIYSKDGFRFFSKLAVAVKNDNATIMANIFPKVDWTRSWTVEEILKEYSYTDAEIKDFMADLDNYKCMS